MVNRSKNATWASVKAELQQMDPKAIVNLVRDIYRSSQENRRFLHARLLGSKTELAKYRKLVVDAIYPDPFSRRPVRVSEAERLNGLLTRGRAVDMSVPFALPTQSMNSRRAQALRQSPPNPESPPAVRPRRRLLRLTIARTPRLRALQ